MSGLAIEVANMQALKAKMPEVADFLCLLANSNRLLLLCHVSQGKRSVPEIQHDLGLKQPALSQQLAGLRQSGLVEARRARSIYSSIKDGRTRAVIFMLHAIFCADGAPDAAPAAARHASPRCPEPARAPAGDAVAFAGLHDHPAVVDD